MSQHHSEPTVDERTLAFSVGDVDAIADATATQLAKIMNRAPGTFALVDARQLAGDLGASLDCMDAHATELGAPRLGSEPQPSSTDALNVVGLKPGLMAQFGYEDSGQLVVPMRARRRTGCRK